MRLVAILGVLAVLTGCAVHDVKCTGHLERINPVSVPNPLATQGSGLPAGPKPVAVVVPRAQ